ncbi:MAG TPA: CPBP family intramembrane glutamic endopeptidase [Thermoanaerobaculia bacterium]|nr:CPBP family intramembrane glutamic endopeptidase [Thermoanaerobaculia bacterium]
MLVWVRATLRPDLPAAPLPLSWAPVELACGLLGLLAFILYNAALGLVLPRSAAGRTLASWMSRQVVVMLGRLPLWTLLTVAALAGVCEEIIFRGWLQPLAGIWLTSLLFAVAHFPPHRVRWTHPATWGMIALYIPVSFGMGGLFAWRGDLLAPILTHILGDALGMLRIARAVARKRAPVVNAANAADAAPPS